MRGQGRGRVVLTASRGSEYSWEGESPSGAEQPGSVSTTAIVEGIRSGAADEDHDGYVSVDDAYAFAFDRIRSGGSRQTPQRRLYGAEGKILLARGAVQGAVQSLINDGTYYQILAEWGVQAGAVQGSQVNGATG